MLKYALFDYVPNRKLSKASFELQDLHRMILGFKDGRNIYTLWAARLFARALSAMNLSDTVIVCIPASTRYSNVRRWKRFSDILCRLTGAIDGFDRIQVSGSRKRAHITGDHELATNIKHYVHIDAEYFRNRKVLVIDDIYTTGQSSAAFIAAMQAAGATVTMAIGAMGQSPCFLMAHPHSPAHLNVHYSTLSDEQTESFTFTIQDAHHATTPLLPVPLLRSVAHEMPREPYRLRCGGSHRREHDMTSRTHR